MDIDAIEDLLITTHKNLGLFAQVVSFGREGEPNVLSLPAALIFFDGDVEVASKGRPVDEIAFHVAVRVQNLASEAAAARDAYTLINASRGAVRGKTLGIPGIEPFKCARRQLTDYDDKDGWIEYTLRFTTRQYQPVVTD
jgi:hypothetical protein